MAKKTEEAKNKKDKPPRIIFPEQLDVVYSNSAYLLLSDRDLTIDFGVKRPEMQDKETSEPPTAITTRIIMSLQHAKMFSERLSGLIQGYEKTFGEIPTEPKKK